jgi:hypothetical protein
MHQRIERIESSGLPRLPFWRGSRMRLAAWLVMGILLTPICVARAGSDPRNIASGWRIPTEGYADQPYVVNTGDHAWLCVVTTGKGAEGEAGQHLISMRSLDHGRTWSQPVDIETADGPESSYGVLLKTPGGRIYCFYNRNSDRVKEVRGENGTVFKRVDSLGHYVFKYSDDQGRSWSTNRYDVPVREFQCDRKNVYGGKLRMFWNVGRPLTLGDGVLLTLHKVGAMGEGFFARTEGAFLTSGNLLTEKDPAKITFETLPDGDTGLQAPAGGGKIAEEQNIVALSDGSVYCVYRTVDGWPACSYSRDGGHTWTPPAYVTYAPGGPRLKNPRAANFVWRCSNGKFLYWFHNHGGKAAAARPGWNPYLDRNPAWLAAGIEQNTKAGKIIVWSQPEILLYDDDPATRISYPDLVEDGGSFYVTETQKSIARVHEIPADLWAGLFDQFANNHVATNGLALDLPGVSPMPRQTNMPVLPEFGRDHQNATAGFSLDFWLRLDSVVAGEIILDSRTSSGQGLLVETTASGALGLKLNDGVTNAAWESNPGTLTPRRRQHFVITVDGGPRIITFVVDGVLCDGGDNRQFGWGRFSPGLRSANGSAVLQIGPRLDGAVQALRIYQRALRTSEAVGNFRAGCARPQPS